jgi:O-succinylbenzoate synthase
VSVRIDSVELIRIRLPFTADFRSALGTERERTALLVHVMTDGADGWGECAAMPRPRYTSEYVDGAHSVMRDHLLPMLLAEATLDATDVSSILAPIRGHRMAKAALEMAALDAELRNREEGFARYLGATRGEVECGVAVGITENIPSLLDEVERRVHQGYRRVKLKIAPGWDIEPVAAVREQLGDTIPLTVDANGAYTLEHTSQLMRLDQFALAMIEEPLAGASLVAHAQLARVISTPICLDESIVSVRSAKDALDLGAASIINIKPGRVGGLREAKAVHDLCQQRGVPAWCGGMFETGIGRAANLALAALPGFTLPSDISPSGRHFDVDLITTLAEMRGGVIAVPDGPGLGVSVDRDAIDSVAVSREVIRG